MAENVTNTQNKNFILVVKQTKEGKKVIYIAHKDGTAVFPDSSNNEDAKEIKVLPLKEVTAEEIQKLRTQEPDTPVIPIFLYKENNRFFYTEMPKPFSIIDLLSSEHKCGNELHDCTRLVPVSKSHDACRKVLDYTLKLERYPFIKKGYQVFKSKNNCLIVIECKNYEAIPQKQVGNEELVKQMAIEMAKMKNFYYSSPKADEDDDDDDDIFPRFSRFPGHGR